MSRPAVRYSTAPEFVVNYPTCSACDISLDCDDGWICPKCGTTWGDDATDGDAGDLWGNWSGEGDGDDRPILTHDQGSRAPWIAHPYVPWLTESGHDMRRCHKCYAPKSDHLDGTATS